MVARALSETVGRTWSNTSPVPAALEPELAGGAEAEAELFDASGEGFVSVRSVAGEGEAAGACEASLAEDFAVVVDESREDSRDALRDGTRLGAPAVAFALDPAPAFTGSSLATRDAAFVEEEEEPTPRLRILGSAMTEPTTTSPTAMAMT